MVVFLKYKKIVFTSFSMNRINSIPKASFVNFESNLKVLEWLKPRICRLKTQNQMTLHFHEYRRPFFKKYFYLKMYSTQKLKLISVDIF